MIGEVEKSGVVEKQQGRIGSPILSMDIYNIHYADSIWIQDFFHSKYTLGRLEGRKARRGFYSLHIGIDAIV